MSVHAHAVININCACAQIVYGAYVYKPWPNRAIHKGRSLKGETTRE